MSFMRASAMRLSIPARTALPGAPRAFASQPPRSQSPPAGAKQNSDKAMYAYVAIGLGIGGAFFFLLGRPSKAAAVAHQTSSVPGKQDLKGRDEK